VESLRRSDFAALILLVALAAHAPLGCRKPAAQGPPAQAPAAAPAPLAVGLPSRDEALGVAKRAMTEWEYGSSDQVLVDEASGEYRVKVRRFVYPKLLAASEERTGWTKAEVDRLQATLDKLYRDAEIYLHLRHDEKGWIAIGWTVDGQMTTFHEEARVK
jgi:hypothetical protein